jgi:hypothetical protein
MTPKETLLDDSGGEYDYGLNGWTISGTITPTLVSQRNPFAGLVLQFYRAPGSLLSSNPSTALAAEQGWISQVITVPVDLPSPTLAFMYQMQADHAWQNSGLQVQATTQNGTDTLLHLTKSAPEWSQVWTDLTPYAGQTITLTLGLEQFTTEPAVTLNLYHLSAGAWTTPIIKSISLGDLQHNQPITGTLIGVNLDPALTLKLDQQTSLTPQWIDSQTIIFQLPTGIRPGYHEVWLYNPDGAMTAAIITVGKPTFIPIVTQFLAQYP